jgi:hypothetical protein
MKPPMAITSLRPGRAADGRSSSFPAGGERLVRRQARSVRYPALKVRGTDAILFDTRISVSDACRTEEQTTWKGGAENGNENTAGKDVD